MTESSSIALHAIHRMMLLSRVPPAVSAHHGVRRNLAVTDRFQKEPLVRDVAFVGGVVWRIGSMSETRPTLLAETTLDA